MYSRMNLVWAGGVSVILRSINIYPSQQKQLSQLFANMRSMFKNNV